MTAVWLSYRAYAKGPTMSSEVIRQDPGRQCVVCRISTKVPGMPEDASALAR